MSARFFLDTNIIVYSFDSNSTKKQKIAQQLIEEALLTQQGIISFQVLQEFVNFSLKAKHKPLTLDEVRRFSNKILRPLCAVQSSFLLYQKAFSIKENFKFSWYDSLIIASAIEGGCETLYSEDMQNKRIIEGMVIKNPF